MHEYKVVFSLADALDPDRDPAYLDILVYSKRCAEEHLYQYIYGLPVSGALTTWAPEGFFGSGEYVWTARAVDAHGLASDWTPEAQFLVACHNDAECDEGSYCHDGKCALALVSGTGMSCAMVQWNEINEEGPSVIGFSMAAVLLALYAAFRLLQMKDRG